ncbi:hypothetical protein [Mycobacterium lepromatosis]|uniref:hypothetical protein n=1 Tax=Mycobacterium lepromatosis TaxID=480418 RepID=UPI00138E500A|nr:hypothetical protein [Mycobacterium lepromatosis]
MGVGVITVGVETPRRILSYGTPWGNSGVELVVFSGAAWQTCVGSYECVGVGDGW